MRIRMLKIRLERPQEREQERAEATMGAARTRKNLALGFVAAAALIASGSAQALTIDSSQSGLDQALGCSSTFCVVGTEIFALDASAPVGGTLELSGGTLDFTITLASASLSGTDGAVTGLTFSDVTYSGSVSATDQSPNGYSISGTSTISGTVTPIGAGAAQVFDAVSVNTSGLCTGTPGDSLVCGLNFTAADDFNTGVNGNTRHFVHQVDVMAVIPEPGTALLLGLGLSLLARRQPTRA